MTTSMDLGMGVMELSRYPVFEFLAYMRNTQSIVFIASALFCDVVVM